MPPGTLVYAVGDIHGRADLLQRVLDRIETDAGSLAADRRILVFLGDYVDRGRDSRQVIDILLGGLPSGFEARYLLGNHEALLMDALADGARVPEWLMNGGDATLASYGVDMVQPGDGLRAAFSAALPDAHRTFLASLETHVVLGGYLFVHAGLRPGVPLERQSRHDMIWIREEFLLSDADFGHVVVHGHTPGPRPVTRSNRIGIDTLAWQSGLLTALRLREGTRAFLDTR